MPDIPSNRETGNAMTIGIVLAEIVAALILAGSVFFQSDQKGVDVSVNQPSTELPTTGDTKRHRFLRKKGASASVGALFQITRIASARTPPLPLLR